MGTSILNRAPLEIASLARIPIGETAPLPAEGGVYLAIDDANRVWYVGLAESIRDRILTHDRLADWKKRGASSIAWKTESNASARRILERDLIEFFHPPLNSQHNFNALPAGDLGLTPDQEIERFFRLRLQLKRIELELEALKPNIVTRCDQSGGKIVHALGSLQAQTYKSWAFTDAVDLLKLKLQRLQQEEKENGLARVKGQSRSPVAKLSPDAMAKEIGLLIDDEPDTFADDSPTAA